MHHTSFRARLSAALILTGFAGQSPAAATTLTFVDAQHIAIERSQQLIAQDFAIRSSREMAVAARQLPDPVVRAGIDNLPVQGPDRISLNRDFMTMRRIGVMQKFTGAEKRRLRAQRFEHEADRAGAELNATVATIQRDTAIAWLEAFYIQRLRRIVADQLNESRLEIDALQGAYRGGRASQAEVLNAHSARVMLEDRLSELDRRSR